jgi:hypothetical protein
MVSVLIDRYALGAVAEETGLVLRTEPDNQTEYRSGMRIISLDLIVPGGRGRIRLYSYVPVGSGTIPPEVPGV